MKTRPIALFVAALAAPLTAHAGGIFIPGYGEAAQPRGGAFVAKADDPSALFHNPAGFAKLKGRTTFHLSSNLLSLDQRYQRTTGDGVYEATGEDPADPWEGEPYPAVENEAQPHLGFGSFQAIPLFAVATDFGLELPLTFGLGVKAANGYPGRDYNEDYAFDDPNQPPPPQRYDIMSQEVVAAFPSLAAAYRVTPDLDVGVRLSWGIVQLKATSAVWALPGNYEENIGTDGLFEVDVEDAFVPAFGVGALYRPAPMFEIGFRYDSPKEVNGKGTGVAILGSDTQPLAPGSTEVDFIAPETDFPQCAPGGTLAGLKACLNFTLPQTAAVGARWILRDERGSERADVEFDVQWEDWSAASNFEVIVDGKSGLTGIPLKRSVIRHGLQDTFSFRLGGSYGLPIGANRLIFRGGGAYDTAAAPNSWTRLDIDGFARTTLGAGLAFETERFRIGAGGGVVLEGDRTVDSGCNPTEADGGCDGSGVDTPVEDRTRPDPVQPINEANNQAESPFNDGVYEQGYLQFSVGVTTWF